MRAVGIIGSRRGVCLAGDVSRLLSHSSASSVEASPRLADGGTIEQASDGGTPQVCRGLGLCGMAPVGHTNSLSANLRRLCAVAAAEKRDGESANDTNCILEGVVGWQGTGVNVLRVIYLPAKILELVGFSDFYAIRLLSASYSILSL